MGVQDAVAAVCAFSAEGELGALAIEFCSPLNQFVDALGSVFLPQHFGGFGIAKSIPALQRVLKVETDLIFVAKCGCNASLGPLRVGLGDFALCLRRELCQHSPAQPQRATLLLRRQSPGNRFGTAQTS